MPWAFVMKIDAHQHFWKYHAMRHSWITEEMAILKRDFLPENLEPERKASGIDSTIAVQAEQSEDETLFLHQLAARNPSIAGVGGRIDLRSPQTATPNKVFSKFRQV